jgi:membrane-bound ClpP family serine protease
MNVLKALFNSSLTESDVVSESFSDVMEFSDIKPLWANITEIQAVVTQTIAPQVLGRVKFRGTRWRALSDRAYPIAEGTVVRVIGRQRSNILVVEPVHELAA